MTNPNSHAILELLKEEFFHFYQWEELLEPLRFDISKPCIGIISSNKILPFIEKEPAFQPSSDTPPEILKNIEKSLLDKYEGFFITSLDGTAPVNSSELNIVSVLSEDDQARLDSLSVCPFPYEVLSNILPVAFTGSFWKEKLVWGCILYPDNDSCILLLGTYEDCDVKVERRGDRILISSKDAPNDGRVKGVSADECPDKNMPVLGLIKLIRDSVK